jgi:hypothetical protein
MTWLDWILIGLVWMLVPAGLIMKARQDARFRRWQKEDNENIAKEIFKHMRN